MYLVAILPRDVKNPRCQVVQCLKMLLLLPTDFDIFVSHLSKGWCLEI